MFSPVYCQLVRVFKITSHISVNKTWVDMVDNNIISGVRVHHLLLDPCQGTQGNFGHCIGTVGPPLVNM